MSNFVHLHNHSDYSLLDGAVSIQALVDKAASFGMKHLALTDHGNMFGVLRFYKACKKAEINPIIGCEFYVAGNSRFSKTGTEHGNKYFHMILLAKNVTGYRNLINLTSQAYLEGFYYKPRIDDELLEQYHEGLIASSACLAGEIPSSILHGQLDRAKERALYFQNLFGKDHFYLELQDHGIPEQKTANEGLIALSRETGIPLIAANDIHYLEKEHANAQDILICIGTNKKKNDHNRLKFNSQEFYFKSPEEMKALFPDVPEAISNTVKLAEMCNLEIPLPGPLLPEYEIPDEFDSPESYMRHITYEGIEQLYPEVTEEIRARTDYELNTIFNMGFTGYFLIVWDFIHFARENDIPVGPGRGSGAGSIVAYGMRITDVDPLKYNLLFERFLNTERVSMPDFDVDFCFERRGEVIDYVTEKYGKDNVASICTFGTLKTKAVFKYVARVLDVSFTESNIISKLIPEGKAPDGRKVNMEVALDIEPKLKEYYVSGSNYQEVFDTAKILEGLNRHVSTHACGMVIGKTKLTDYVPLYRDSKTGQISTEFTMDQLEECGLVKMDFLGLKTLTLIKNTEKLIRKREPEFSEMDIPEDDPITFKMLGAGKSTAVFQFESTGMQSILKRAKPTTLEEMIALNALYRPGPMQYIPQYIDSKMGRQKISYPDPSLEEILKPTYGVIVYQEQVMQVAQIIGGFSLGKADILRRAMGKKKVKEMDKMKIEFVQGAQKKGHTKEHAEGIFEMLKPFAGYGFNKSHAAAYSIVAYKTAYLKANYPAEFMAANLTNEIGTPDNFSLYLSTAREMGITVRPPDINLSEKEFTVVDGDIIYGLMGIKNVGEAAVTEIIRVRDQEGPFESLMDFLQKVDLKTVNRKVVEMFVQSGLFDNTGESRAVLLHNLERLLEWVSKEKESREFGQTSLFDDAPQEELPTLEMIEVPDFPKSDILQMEKDNLGIYFSGHPLDQYRKTWEKMVDVNLGDIKSTRADKTYVLLGMIKSIKQIFTRKGTQMAFSELEDFNGSLEITFFPKIWEQYHEMIVPDAIVGLEGKIDSSRGNPQLLVDKVLPPEELKKREPKEVHIKLDGGLSEEEELFNFRALFSDLEGNCPLYIHVQDDQSGKEVIIRASSQIRVDHRKEILSELMDHPHIMEAWHQ